VSIAAVRPSDEATAAAAIRVLVADDVWHYAQALESTLRSEPDIDVVGVSYSAEETLELVAQVAPDVVLLDLDLPEMGGVAVCSLLRERHPRIAVVIVTGLIDAGLARESLAAGACGYVIKHDQHDPDRVAAAVRAAARGDLWLDRDTQTLIRALAALEREREREALLTRRQREVLALIAEEGLQNKQIAERLHMSPQTVKNHLNEVYRRLGVTNRTQAIAEARRRGIVRV
jgi:DNA-binding NarL/FixJ family response regulator